MARLSPIQESFTSGEIGERIRGRVSSPTYAAGLKRARNWMPLVQGPIRLRDGTEFIEAVDPANWTDADPHTQGVRVFTFNRGVDEDIIVEIGAANVVLKGAIDGSQVIGGVSDQLLFDHLYSGDFGTAWAILPNFFDYLIEPGVSSVLEGPFNKGTPQAYWRMSLLTDNSPEGATGAALRSILINIPPGSETLIAELKVQWRTNFSSDQLTLLGDLPLTDVVVKVQVGTTPLGAEVLDTNITINFNNEFITTTFNFVPGVGNTPLFLRVGIAYISGSVPDLGPNKRPFTDITDIMFDVGVMSFVIPLAGGSGAPATFVSPYTLDQLECVQFCVDPGEKMAFLTHPQVETQRLRESNGEWTLEPISSITLPDPFVTPVGSVWTNGNFPGACAFHEGRLYLAATPNEPSTIWGSRSGNYVDFGAAAPNSKDDPVEFPLSSAGTVMSLTSRKQLVINTSISEVIGKSVQGVIAFDDFSFPKQTDWGSDCIQPMVVGRDMIYVSASKRKVRTFADEGGTNYGWDGKELSLLAEEIFGFPIRRMVFLDEPFYQACFLLNDGSIAMATYYYPEEVVGFWRLDVASNGSSIQPINRVMDITSVNTSQGSKLWMLVNRVGFAGTLKIHHEQLAFDQGKVALDASARRNVNENTGICIDLDHLDDQTVNVVVERTGLLPPFATSFTVHPDVVITAGATPPLADWAWGSTAHFGHRFDNDFQLLSLEGVSQRGTSQVSKRRWNKVFLRLNNSPVPLVEGQYPRDRLPSAPMGEGQPFVTGDTEIVDLGSGEGDLIITQDKPLVTEVVGLFGKVGSGEV